jgi:hypothetical protein
VATASPGDVAVQPVSSDTVCAVPTIRLLWITPPMTKNGWEAETHQSIVDAGKIHVRSGEFPGPEGTYHLLPADQSVTIEPHDLTPTFLHESYEGRLEMWMQSLTDAADEIVIIARVRDAVSQLADIRLVGNPNAFPAGPAFTTTEPTAQGMAVVGRCLILQPAV